MQWGGRYSGCPGQPEQKGLFLIRRKCRGRGGDPKGLGPARAREQPMMIGYARVSTGEQNPALQFDALAAAGCDQIFTDHASGVLTSRPSLDQVLASLRAGDTLVTWKLDRLGRSLSHLIQVVAMLEARGVSFRSLSEAIDTRTASGRLLFHVMGALAEFERALISERTRAGMAAARSRGALIGRPSILSVQEVEAVIDGGCGAVNVRDLALRFSVSGSTIRRALRRRFRD